VSFEKKSCNFIIQASLPQRWLCSYKFKNRRIGSWTQSYYHELQRVLKKNSTLKNALAMYSDGVVAVNFLVVVAPMQNITYERVTRGQCHDFLNFAETIGKNKIWRF
jgi:hypothetical protein